MTCSLLNPSWEEEQEKSKKSEIGQVRRKSALRKVEEQEKGHEEKAREEEEREIRNNIQELFGEKQHANDADMFREAVQSA